MKFQPKSHYPPWWIFNEMKDLTHALMSKCSQYSWAFSGHCLFRLDFWSLFWKHLPMFALPHDKPKQATVTAAILLSVTRPRLISNNLASTFLNCKCLASSEVCQECKCRKQTLGFYKWREIDFPQARRPWLGQIDTLSRGRTGTPWRSRELQCSSRASFLIFDLHSNIWVLNLQSRLS